jgi:two-component system, cell cycle sensor histidine kinase and response regulator CckA
MSGDKNVNDDEITKEQLITELAKARLQITELEKSTFDSKQMEEALKESEERYRRITSAITDYIFTVHVEDGIAVRTLHTPVCETVTGYTAEEFNNDPFLWLNMVVEEDREIVRDHASRILEGENVGAIEHRIKRKDGSVRWVSNTPVLHRDQGGILISYDGVIRDITGHKQAEEALRESEQRLKIILHGSPISTFVIDKDHRVIYWNEALEHLSGIKTEDIVGTCDHWKAFYDSKRPCMADLIVDGALDAIPEWYPSKFSKSQLINEAYEAIDFFPSLKGKGKWLRFTAAVIRNTAGDLVGAIETLEDITESKQTDEERKKLEAQLIQAQKMEALGTLAGGIAHDFNNILSAIIAYAEGGKHIVPDTDKVRKNIDEILKVSSRARDLVKQILAFSRRTKHEYIQLKLDATVKESLKMLRAILPKTIEIHQNLPTNGRIMADSTQIHQVVMNLCSNAAHAMGERGGVLEVSLNKVDVHEGAEALALDLPPGPFLRLSVSDTGHGMTPEVLERIFDPYFTTKEKGRGTGLGLSVVHGIVKSHKGAITCKSMPGEGTTIDIYLPEIEFKKEAAAPRSETSCLNGTERILFIDDEQILGKAVKEGLRNLGYRVVTRTSSIDALDLFRKHPDQFDLVITDIIMPVMSGDRLAQEMLKIRPNIPVILCTGYSEQMTEEKAKELGAQEFIMKPMEIKDLANTIRRVLDGK